MKINDQIGVLLSDCMSLLRLCPADDPESTANVFEGCARRIGGVAAWLSGQAVLLRGVPCDDCKGQGHINGQTCERCGGAGRVPR